MEQFIRLFKSAVEEYYRLDKIVSNMTFDSFDLEVRAAELNNAMGKIEAYYNVASILDVSSELLRKIEEEAKNGHYSE